MRVPLLVVGAGLSGLALAAQAARAGVGVMLLEARPCIGGRVLSLPAAGGAHDLGAAWVWPSLQPRLARLIHDAGLRTYAQHGAGAFL
ncbi:MAG: NAD(P)-binding protein, partial [Xanthomonadaceae bacterium]|nr:NAD(P)-binding protein [Xanthomonadaceae bacterium]